MAGIPTLSAEETLFTLRDEWLYTVARVLKNPYAASFAPEIQAVGPVVDAALKTQRDLEDAIVMAAAGRDAADDVLDPVVLQFLAAVLVVTHGDREDPLYVSYAGDQTAKELVKPLLGPELDVVSEWIEPLNQETDPALNAFAAPITKAVSAGQDAEKTAKDADKALYDFRLVGDRKKALDALNAARGSLYGKLLQFQHDHPELRLGSGWAESFFRHETRTPKYGSTVAQAEAYIVKLEQEKVAATAHREVLKKKEADREAAKAKRQAAREALAQARKAVKDAKAQEKALEAEANKKVK